MSEEDERRQGAASVMRAYYEQVLRTIFPYFRWLVTGLPTWRPVFHLRPGRVGFVRALLLPLSNVPATAPRSLIIISWTQQTCSVPTDVVVKHPS